MNRRPAGNLPKGSGRDLKTKCTCFHYERLLRFLTLVNWLFTFNFILGISIFLCLTRVSERHGYSESVISRDV